MAQNRNLAYYQGLVSRPEALVASAARTTTGTGSVFAVEENIAIVAKLDVTVVTGTSPTLDARLEVTYDGTNYVTAASFTQKTGVSNETKGFIVAGATSARWAWTIGGTTPNFTFALTNATSQ